MTGPDAGRYRLVLLRHGQSEWNAANLFTGWVNAALTAEGEREATDAGRLLADRGRRPEVVHTSLQRRAISTADLALAAEYSQFADARYAALPPEARPLTESLRDVTARLLPYWYDAIIPDLRTGACVLVVSHGNTIRALIRHLDRMSEEEIVTLNVATAVPLVYELDRDLRPVTRPECAGPGSGGRAPG